MIHDTFKKIDLIQICVREKIPKILKQRVYKRDVKKLNRFMLFKLSKFLIFSIPAQQLFV